MSVDELRDTDTLRPQVPVDPSSVTASADMLPLVRGVTAEVMKCDESEIDVRQTFEKLGLDSLTAVELRDQLDRVTGRQLPSTLIFDYPTPESLAVFLAHDGSPAGQVFPVAPPATSPATDTHPVAIVGMACRFPGGVDSPEGLWDLVSSGQDAVSAFPSDRGWDVERLYDPDPDRSGTLYVREGGFLGDALGFDAAFFGISPREALAMDPQQRLLLELSWEALERAGLDPSSLKGSATGVFAGYATFDFPVVLRNVPDVDMYYTTGTHASVASGRVAYALGLEGPAVTVDTACSSSLVALHMAVQALRAGECTLALAGGATVLSGPSVYLGFCRQRALAADGRCKAFAEAADGFGPAEGAGVLVLERLSDAERRGHRVLAVVSGSAVNQDGASNGLTAPNGPSQQRVIRGALTAAGLGVGDVDVVEAHGTGTALGDPIEAQALLATYGQRESGLPALLLGSVKSNIGHSQAAAGVAGVIKAVMALRHGVVPATLHVDRPSSHVDWSAGAVQLATETMPWPQTGRPRRAAVSAFGISGTNAHVVLEQSPDTPQAPRPEEVVAGDRAVPWVVSARSPQALREAAARLGEYAVAHPGVGVGLVGSALARRRTAMEHRAVVLARSVEAAVAGLSAVAADESAAGVVTGEAIRRADPVLVFPGQGSQWVGMGRALLATSPVFAEWITRCQAAFAPYVEWSLEAVLRGEDAAVLERVDVVQPALFAVLTGLAQLWQHHGVTVSAVLGHSQGEIAAAYVAGALSLDDAARVVTLRSKALVELAGTGAMASVMLGRQATEELLRPWQQRLSVAAANGPSATIVSGEMTAIEEMLRQLEGAGTWARRIPVDYASHSAQIEAIRDTILSALHGITPQPARIPFYSAYTGDQIDTTELTADYWYANLRHTVQFQTATERLLDQGHRLFIESSPHPVLTTALQQTIEESGHHAAVLATLHRDQATLDDFTTSLARAYTHGAAINWDTLLPTDTALATDLPTYPFQHQRYWPDTTPTTPTTPTNPHAHPFLDTVIEHADTGNLLLSGHIALNTHPWLGDHTVAGTTIFPGTGFLELALHAAHEAGCHHLEELTLETPLLLPEHETTQIQVTVGPEDHTRTRPITIHSRTHTALPGTPWTRHAQGVVATTAGPLGAATMSEWPPAGAEEVAIGDFYTSAEQNGYEYGPNFRGLRAVWRRGEELFAEAVVPEEMHAEAGRFGLHPALLDSALQATMLQRRTGDVDAGAWLPFIWTGVSLSAAGATALRIRLAPVGAETFTVNLADATGRPVASVATMLSRQVSAEHFAAADDTLRQALFEVAWRPLPVGPDARVGLGCAVLGSDVLGLSEALGGVQVYPALGALEADPGSRPEAVVVPCVAPVGDDPAQAAIDLSDGLLALLQDWLADERWEATRLVVTTTDAMVVAGEPVIDPGAAAVWGLVRSATAEHPGRFLLVDLDSSVESSKVLPTALASAIEQDETELVIRQGNVFVPRLAPLAGQLESRTPEVSSGTVLITGGTGMLGGLLARHAVQVHHVPHLVLLGRRGRSAPGMVELETELVGLGAKVTVAECDATDRAELSKVLAGIDPEYPLVGIVHAAGVLEDSTVEALTSSQLERVMAPKVRTAWNLHELTHDQQLSMFMMFSSASGLLGTAGQANYAAANTFLDALAQYRRAHGLTATSLAWGLWEQASGLTGHLDDVQLERVRRAGVLRLPTRDGLTLFDGCLRADQPVVIPAKLDAAGLRTQADRGRLQGLLRGLVRSSVRRVAEAPAAESGNALQRLLQGVAAGDRERALVELVAKQAAEVLGRHSAADIVEEQSFTELGFESLTAVELRNRLSQATGIRLPATLVFDHPSPAAIARHLLTLLCPEHGDEERRNDVIGDVTVTEAEDDPAALLASMDVDDLVRMALGGDGS